jgi:AraC-like DNA-binding protein
MADRISERAVATAGYREFAPPPAVAHLIDCLWMRGPGAGDPPLHRVFPDGAADLVLTPAGAVLYGPAVSVRLIRHESVFGLRIRPGAAKAVLGLPPKEFLDATVPLDCVWGRRAETFAECLAHHAEPGAAEASLMRLLARTSPLDGAVMRALVLIRRNPGCGVAALAREVGLSERQLRRRFADHVGLGVKSYARIVRFERVLDAARRHKRLFGAAAPGWASVAAEHGFADQAHLVRETKALAGLTPAALMQAL